MTRILEMIVIVVAVVIVVVEKMAQEIESWVKWRQPTPYKLSLSISATGRIGAARLDRRMSSGLKNYRYRNHKRI